MSFAPTVRRVVDETLAGAELVEITKGSGPVLTFALRPQRETPKLRPTLQVQKGLHGAGWFRYQLGVEFLGQGKGVEDARHAVSVIERRPPVAEVPFSGATDLVTKLREALCSVDGAADELLTKPRRAYGELDALLGHLVEHYATWWKARGHAMPPSDFILTDDDDRECAAFDDFRSWCGEQGLVELPQDRMIVTCRKVPAVRPDLWFFWTDLRPETAAEVSLSDYRPCSVCAKWSSRGKAAQRRDEHFGPYAVFVCAACAKEASVK